MRLFDKDFPEIEDVDLKLVAGKIFGRSGVDHGLQLKQGRLEGITVLNVNDWRTR